MQAGLFKFLFILLSINGRLFFLFISQWINSCISWSIYQGINSFIHSFIYQWNNYFIHPYIYQWFFYSFIVSYRNLLFLQKFDICSLYTFNLCCLNVRKYSKKNEESDMIIGFPVVITLRITLSFTYAGALREITKFRNTKPFRN